MKIKIGDQEYATPNDAAPGAQIQWELFVALAKEVERLGALFPPAKPKVEDPYPWGFDNQDGGWWPLPVTERFGLMKRQGDKEPKWPPYLAARTIGEKIIEVMLCEGDGYRAGYDRENEDDSQCIYGDGDLPEEWRERVTALVENFIKKRWPRKKVVYRPVKGP